MGRPRHDNVKTMEQTLARDLYVKKTMSPEDIVKALKSAGLKEVSEASVYRWANKYGWRKERQEFLTVPFTAGEELRKQLTSMPERLQAAKTPEDFGKVTDGFTKLVAAISKLDDSSNRLGAILWTVNRIQKYMQTEIRMGLLGPEFAAELAAFFDRFSIAVTEGQN